MAAANGPVGVPTPSAPTVLVVDDEEMVRRFMRRLLAEAGFHSLEAAGGSAALGLLAESGGAVDLVLTDVIMPGMDGCTLGREIAARYPQLPVLYVSAYTSAELIEQGLCRTELPFLRKPFTPSALIEKIRGVLVRS